jgi:hypothetical protein
MKGRTFLVATLPLAALAAWACAVNPGPGEPGYRFNVSGLYQGSVMVEGLAFNLSMELFTGAGGTLAGDYRVTDPVAMSGPVTGALVADSVSFSLNYTRPMDGCSGFLQGEGTVEPGGDSFSGRARISDSCDGSLIATFSMRR